MLQWLLSDILKHVCMWDYRPALLYFTKYWLAWQMHVSQLLTFQLKRMTSFFSLIVKSILNSITLISIIHNYFNIVNRSARLQYSRAIILSHRFSQFLIYNKLATTVMWQYNYFTLWQITPLLLWNSNDTFFVLLPTTRLLLTHVLTNDKVWSVVNSHWWMGHDLHLQG